MDGGNLRRDELASMMRLTVEIEMEWMAICLPAWQWSVGWTDSQSVSQSGMSMR